MNEFRKYSLSRLSCLLYNVTVVNAVRRYAEYNAKFYDSAVGYNDNNDDDTIDKISVSLGLT